MNAPASFGHNEVTVRLGLLADDARNALARVESGETTALEGWLAYGAALNEGRKQFHPDDDKGFGGWVADLHRQLVGVEPNDHERAAAMWAAAFPEQFEIAKADCGARTVRGIHKHWGIIDAERKAAEKRAEAEAARAKAEAERKAADEARRKAEADREEAKARAEAEAAALRAEKEAKDAEQRRAALAQAEAAKAARAELERQAKEADAIAQAAEKAAKASEKAADTADKSAKREEKKADKAKKGEAVSGDNYRTVTTGENEWYTPAEFVDLARAVMGDIDLDPASCGEANQIVKAPVYYTEADNGLSREWSGRVWLNPPYSRDLMPAFCEKLAAHVDAGDVTAAILVSHNNTETNWFHRLASSCAAACFPSRRIRFYRGEEVAAPVNGQVFFYFGQDADAFKREFARVGWVVVSA
jgi:ParB family chromosome partitioning protein